MALKGKYILNRGNIVLDDAYVVIEKVLYNHIHVEIFYNVYKSKEEKEKSGSVADNKRIVAELQDYEKFFKDEELKKENISLLKNAYEYMKTIDVFKDFLDV